MPRTTTQETILDTYRQTKVAGSAKVAVERTVSVVRNMTTVVSCGEY